MNPTPRIAALVVAAGNGSRVGGAVPKQYQRIGGKALLRYSLEALLAHPAIRTVQVVIHPDHRAYYDSALLNIPPPLGGRLGGGLNVAPHVPDSAPPPPSPYGGGSKLLPPVFGGAERADSVAAGLKALTEGGLAPGVYPREGGDPSLKTLTPAASGSPSATHATASAPDYVLIHDAARPFLSHAMLDSIIATLAPGRGVVPALAVADTVRRYADGAWQEVPRDGLLRIQTPQGFDFVDLQRLYSSSLRGAAGDAAIQTKENTRAEDSAHWIATPSARDDGIPSTDDAAIWLAAGLPLDYVQGAEELRKVTTAEDMQWAQQRTAPRHRVAVGSGYDVHALMPTANEEGMMRIGGIDIPSAHKLHGHSDADVVLHAVVDALLGALAEGDIGSHFPPSDPQWHGADSKLFVAEALRLVRARGGEIQHLDITIIAERPKISPHRDAMRAAIAAMLSLPIPYVSVKATTTEKLGFTGREEGIAAHATVAMLLPEVR